MMMMTLVNKACWTNTCKNYWYDCAYHCAQLRYIILCRTFLIIFLLIFQTIVA